VDFDGEHEYSEIKTVLIPRDEQELLVFPNPSKGTFQVQLPESRSDNAYLELYDSQGQMIWQMLLEANPTHTIIQPDLLAKGIYFLRLQDNRHSVTQRIMVYN